MALPANQTNYIAKSCLRLSLSLLLLAPGLPARAQDPAQVPPDSRPLDSRLTALLQERANLTRRYAEANAQRHSLFGNKASKKDLQEVVDALQGIVDKDQQIVDVLNQTAQAAQTTSVRLAATTTHLENTGRDDRNLTAQRLAELENEAANYQQREKQQLVKRRDLEAELAEVGQGKLVRDGLIVALALACVGLVVARRRK